ncbi:hypothetical protein TNCV_3719121 [Trichonephila clavipes]|nr:hypothetical protein TNCV_3719121 [Trichonephila clavipes]
MVSRPTTGVPLAPCRNEFRGSRSDYVRQVALETTQQQQIKDGSELANMVANDAKMVAKVSKLATNLVAKNDANLALPPSSH